MNFQGLLRERGTRLPMAGVLVTMFRETGEADAQAVGFEATADAERAASSSSTWPPASGRS